MAAAEVYGKVIICQALCRALHNHDLLLILPSTS